MRMAAGSTAAPAAPSSPRPAPPNPGQLVQVLMHEREARRSMGHMFVGVEVAGSMTHHGVSFEGAWLGAERPEVQQWGERTLHWPPGRSVPWVRVHLCTVDPDTCAAEGDLHIQGKDVKILEGPEELPDGEARLSASDWLREWQGGVATVPESARLYDEEDARAASAGPFVLPPARGATQGAEVGHRLAVLESQILRDLEGGDQRGVKRTTSGEKEEVVQQSREAVTPTPEDRKSLLRVRLESVRAAFNATKPRRLTASRRQKGRPEDHGHSRHDFRGGRRRARAETDSEGSPHSAPTGAQEKEPQQREQRRHKRVRHFEQRDSDGPGEPLKNNASCRGPARRADDVIRGSDSSVCDRRDEDACAPGGTWPDDRRREPCVEVLCGSPSRGQRKDQPWAARGAANARGGARRSVGRAVWVAPATYQLSGFELSKPTPWSGSDGSGMRAEIDKQARSEFKLSGSGANGWQAVK